MHVQVCQGATSARTGVSADLPERDRPKSRSGRWKTFSPAGASPAKGCCLCTAKLPCMASHYGPSVTFGRAVHVSCTWCCVSRSASKTTRPWCCTWAGSRSWCSILVFLTAAPLSTLTLLDERSFATPLHAGSTTWVRWERSQKPSALQLTYRLLVVSFKALSSGQPDGCYGTRRLCSSPDGCWSTDVRLLHAVVPALLAAQVHV